MVGLERGDIASVDLPVAEPKGSEPAGRRPCVVIQADEYNQTRLHTVIIAILTRNTRLADMPGNVLLPAGTAGLRFESVVNVTQVVTVDKRTVDHPIGSLPPHVMDAIDTGLRKVLGL